MRPRLRSTIRSARCGALASRARRLAARRRLPAGCAATRPGRAGALRVPNRLPAEGSAAGAGAGRLGGSWRFLGDPSLPSVGVRGGKEVLIILICLFSKIGMVLPDGGINISVNFYFLSYFIFLAVWVFLPLSFPSCSSLTERPRHPREQRSLHLKLFVLRCRLFSRPHREASAKIPSLPGTDKTSNPTGSPYLPAPPAVVSGISPTSNLPSLFQAPPRCLSHAFPSISWTTAFMITSGCREVRSPVPLLGTEEKEPPWQRQAGLRVQRRFIHSAPYVSTPTNALPGVGAPAVPHTLCLLSPPASLSLSLPLPRSA